MDNEKKLDRILAANRKYPRDAYYFVQGAVNYAVRRYSRGTHISGRLLLQAMVEYACREFSILAPEVLKAWDLTQGTNAGDIVYALIDAGILIANEKDSREDFNIPFDLCAAAAAACALPPVTEMEVPRID